MIKIIRFTRKITTVSIFLATSFILLTTALTILFLLYPEDTAKVMGYYKQSAGVNNQGLVLGAKTSKEKERDINIAGRILKAFNNVSLRTVKIISPETYTRIIPYQAINDINDVITYDEKKNTVLLKEFASWSDLGSVTTVDINGGTIDGVVIGGSSPSSGIFTTLDTGLGANELYDMDQNVQTSSSVTFSTLDTGQGANELYDMNQNVQTSSDVVFNTVSLEAAGVKLSGDDD